MRDPSLLDDIIAFGQRMLRDELVTGTAGNISVRTEDEMVITPSSTPYHAISRDDLVVLDARGTQIGGTGQPSAETPMHAAIYSATDAAAIVHTHSPTAVALSCVLDELPAIHYAIARFGGDTVRVAAYERFGSDDLAATTLRALNGRRGALLRNHGTVTYGGSLDEAYELALLLEWLAEVYWKARQIGEPTILSGAQLDEVVAEAKRRRYALGST